MALHGQSLQYDGAPVCSEPKLGKAWVRPESKTHDALSPMTSEETKASSS